MLKDEKRKGKTTAKMNSIPGLQLDPVKASAALCRKRFFHFVKDFWSVIIPEEPIYNWHIEYICDEVQEIVMRVCKLDEKKDKQGNITRPAKPREIKLEDFLVNIPPGTTKSTIFSVMLPAWAWTVDPTLRILTTSYAQSLSTALAVKSRDIIKSDKYRLYFPEIELKHDQDNKTHYINTSNGERYATSVTGAATGFHAHIIIVDDPLNAQEEASETSLESAKVFMDTTLSTRKIDKAVTVTLLIMQRLNELDPSGNWLSKKNKKVRHLKLPATGDGDIQPSELRKYYVDNKLDAIRMTDEVLAEARTDLGEYGYAGQYDQEPAPETGGIWQKWFIPVPDNEMPLPEEMDEYGTDWDTAFTENDKNAASAGVSAGRIGNIMYIDKIDYVYKEFPQLIAWMSLWAAPHYVEAKANGKSIKQVLVNNGINAIEVEVKGGADKIARARQATPYAQAGRVKVRKSILDKLYNDAQQGLLKFPRAPKKDLADAVAQAIQRLLGLKKFKFW